MFTSSNFVAMLAGIILCDLEIVLYYIYSYVPAIAIYALLHNFVEITAAMT